MGFRLPEKPVLFYPSLARQIGTDEALLYAIYADRLEARGEQDSHGNLSLCLDRNDWLRLADFWNETRLANVTRSLVSHGFIQATSGDARITLTLLPQLPDSVCEELPIVEPLADACEEPAVPVLDEREPVSEPFVVPVAEEEPPVLYQQADAEYVPPVADDPYYASPSAPPVTVQKLPVMEQPPSRDDLRQLRQHQEVQPQNRGPAPTFGGSIGWSKSRPQPGAGNLFATQLDELEQKNKKLHSIFLGWRPSQILFDTLPRHSIPADFAEQLIDEFVLYWLDKDRKETNWDQKFLAWVKREWVQKQTREAREQRYKQDDNSGGVQQGRPDARQKRQRVTAAIMDIKDTDW
ncbi:DnaT-like ssDNA-binding domain-containing protein [Aliamphritea hakodatensis]|uniref:DnaT-like ssDNA-binding domain-containing protein n=1 Tax=Aliamphritea hakodatensis TaxID=2895352 RepID=UPI0022FD5373|nr:DnaT-like ssDNA-binding domain-containing protein [Aliamphritea hakodatensis]